MVDGKFFALIKYVEFVYVSRCAVTVEVMMKAGVIDREMARKDNLSCWLADRYGGKSMFALYYGLEPPHLYSSWEEFDEKVSVYLAKKKLGVL